MSGGGELRFERKGIRVEWACARIGSWFEENESQLRVAAGTNDQ